MSRKITIITIFAIVLVTSGYLISSFLTGTILPKPFTQVEQATNWQVINENKILGVPPHYAPLLFFDKDKGITSAVFSIKKTNDAGYTWKDVFSMEGKTISSLFPSKGYIWAVGSTSLDRNQPYALDKSQPLVLRSKNKGDNWEEVEFDAESREKLNSEISYFRDICFDSTGKAWIIGNGGVVQVNISGSNLSLINIFRTQELFDISCDESNIVWVISKNYVFRYKDSWEEMKIDKKIFFSGIKSLNGITWVLGNSGPPEYSAGILLKSQDNGESWEDKTPKGAKPLNDLNFKEGKGWLIGDNGSIYQTLDNGDSWIRSKSPSKNDLICIFSLDTSNVWISGDNNTILRYKVYPE